MLAAFCGGSDMRHFTRRSCRSHAAGHDIMNAHDAKRSLAKLVSGAKIAYAVDWKFYGHSGRIVAVQLRADSYMSCELYQVEGESLKLIQAHPFCSWTRSPRMVTNRDVKSIEFPITIRQGEGYPINESSIQIDFDMVSKGICTHDISYADDAASVPECPDHD